MYNSLNEVRSDIENGVKIYWKSALYDVKIDFEGDLIIKCNQNWSQELLRESQLQYLFKA
jgi:hypothetical protein